MKVKIPVIRGSISFEYRKIKCLQALDWWVTNLTLQGKNIDLNNFKSDFLSNMIEDSQLNFEDTRDGNRDLSNSK